VKLRTGFNEIDLRALVKSAGGYWNPGEKAWVLSYLAAHELGLERRIVEESLDL